MVDDSQCSARCVGLNTLATNYGPNCGGTNRTSLYLTLVTIHDLFAHSS